MKVRLPAAQLTIADSKPLVSFMTDRGSWTRSTMLDRLGQLHIRLLSETVCQSISRLAVPTTPAGGEENSSHSEAAKAVAENSGEATSSPTRKVQFNNNRSEDFDAVLWATGAASHKFQQHLGLDLSAEGFILVRDTLQSLRYDNVFAVGDCNCLQSHPNTPKAGVYAVREAVPLAANITALIQGTRLQTYTPQSGFLSLAVSGKQEAISSWKGTSFRNYLMWALKDQLDRGFMNLFTPEALGAQPPEFPS